MVPRYQAGRLAVRKPKVLFACVHNSARSQMAQAYLEHFAGDLFEVQSAGFKPTALNPLAVEVMREDGLDISSRRAQSIFELYKCGELFDYVITVCQASQELECPLFPGITQRMHWGFDDPAALSGTRQERLAGTRIIREAIKLRVQQWAGDMREHLRRQACG